MATASPRVERSTRRGPWGTTRQTEKRYGYPAPIRGPIDQLEDRVERLEVQLAAAGVPGDGGRTR